MKHILIEFVAVWWMVLVVGLINISQLLESVSYLSAALAYGMLIFMFSLFSRGYSRGYFNPYYTMFEVLSGEISIERGIGRLIYREFPLYTGIWKSPTLLRCLSGIYSSNPTHLISNERVYHRTGSRRFLWNGHDRGAAAV